MDFTKGFFLIVVALLGFMYFLTNRYYIVSTNDTATAYRLDRWTGDVAWMTWEKGGHVVFEE